MKLEGYKNKKRGTTMHGIRFDPLYQLWEDCISKTVKQLTEYQLISKTTTATDKIHWINSTIDVINTLCTLDEHMTDKQRKVFKDELFCRMQPYYKLVMSDTDFDGTTRKSYCPERINKLLLQLVSNISSKIEGINVMITNQNDTVIVPKDSTPNMTIQPSLNDEQQKEECERNLTDDEIITLVCGVIAWYDAYDESFIMEDGETDYDKKKFNVISSACDLCLSLLEFSKRGNLGDHILFQDKILSQWRFKHQKLLRFRMPVTKDECHPMVVYSDILSKTQRLTKILLESPIRFDTDLLISMKFESEPDRNSVEYLDFVLDKCADFVSRTTIQRDCKVANDLIRDIFMIRRHINDSNKLNVFNKCKYFLYKALNGVKMRNVYEVSSSIARLVNSLVMKEERIGIKNEENESEIDETDDDDFC